MPRPRITLVVRAGADQIESTFSKTAAKALEVNLNPKWYGVLAEIGAGQEVARWFFRVGAAAGTIAKSISAYDMTISDATYGKADRYVTRDRVQNMLDYEYLQCFLTLKTARGKDTAFFAFADTVVAKAFGRDNECHGWLGIKYQGRPGAEPNTVMIHCRMLDSTAQLQQEALGILGVNLVHGSLSKAGSHYQVLAGLMDDLSRARIEVDLVDFSGPDYKGVDKRCVALRLVEKGLCDAALFSPSGNLQIPQEALYKKNVLITRGRFRPFTLLHNDMLIGAASQFFCDPDGTGVLSSQDFVGESGDAYTECVYRDDTLVLLELTTRDMMEGGDLLDWTNRDGGIQEESFIQRIEALSTMGYSVLLSNYRRYFSLASYLSTFSKESIVISMGIPSVRELFKEKHYADLDGGILEGFGRLLKYDLKLYVYPTLDEQTGKLITAETLQVEPKVQKLYDYIRERGTILPINDYSQELLSQDDVHKRVAESIRSGTEDWEKLVPNHVRDQIKRYHLLGYRSRPAPKLSNGSAIAQHTKAQDRPQLVPK